MKTYRTTIVLGVSLLCISLIMPLGAWAKPRKVIVNGCTFEQITSNFGNSCGDQGMDDLKNNRTYTHVLFCNGDERSCCTVDNSNNQVINCRRPAGSRTMTLQGTVTAPTGRAEVQSRGVEGAEVAGEESPAPEWITEERMKQVKKDMQAK